MSSFWRKKIYYGVLGHEPPRPGHRYRSVITGEVFEIATVGKHIVIDRTEMPITGKERVLRATFDAALNEGFVSHDESCQCEYV